ncbi:hypothetical protein BH09MYX1_BH09MYX1_15530 [soil metagenome]
MSSAIERGSAALARWLAAEDPDAAVARFRPVFAGIVVLYDVIDVALGATEHETDWFPHARDQEMLFLQLALIGCGLLLAFGKWVYITGIICAALRFEEARIFALNDFHFIAVLTLLVAHGQGGPFSGEGAPKNPKWVRDALLAQVAFVYLATAWLKLGPAWIRGDGIYVRTMYLAVGSRWPFPGFIERALGLRAFDGWLARGAVLAEGALAITLIRRRPYILAVGLAVGIHAFGAVATNVWFFGAVMITTVVMLMPRGRRGRRGRRG